MLDFWYRTAPTFERCRRLCTAFECRRPLMAFERMRTRQWERCINLGLLTVTYGRAFWDRISYRIVIFCTVSYRIYRFPPRPYRAITNATFLLWWATIKRMAVDKASPNTAVPLIVANQHFLFSAWQTQLLRLAISPWLRVWGAAVRHLPSILRPESSHTCIDRRHRPHSLTHIGGHGTRRWTNNADRR